MWFPAKITSGCIWVTIPVDWVILHWYTCSAEGRSLRRAGGRCTVTWLPNFLGWVVYFIFLPMVLRYKHCAWRRCSPTLNHINTVKEGLRLIRYNVGGTCFHELSLFSMAARVNGIEQEVQEWLRVKPDYQHIYCCGVCKCLTLISSEISQWFRSANYMFIKHNGRNAVKKTRYLSTSVRATYCEARNFNRCL